MAVRMQWYCCLRQHDLANEDHMNKAHVRARVEHGRAYIIEQQKGSGCLSPGAVRTK
jgi:hypothetical protein